jgi:hypothetical protein
MRSQSPASPHRDRLAKVLTAATGLAAAAALTTVTPVATLAATAIEYGLIC